MCYLSRYCIGEKKNRVGCSQKQRDFNGKYLTQAKRPTGFTGDNLGRKYI